MVFEGGDVMEESWSCCRHPCPAYVARDVPPLSYRHLRHSLYVLGLLLRHFFEDC